MRKFYLILLFFFTKISWAQSLEEKKAIQEGNAYYIQKKYEKAKLSYEKVIASTPSSVKANYNLGNTYYHLKKYDQAIKHFEKAAQSSLEKIDKANSYHNLGNAYMQKMKYKEAVEAFKKSLRNNPSDNQTRYNYALAKKLLNSDNKKQNPPDLPKPSEFAKKMKDKADQLAKKGEFEQAYNTMQTALSKDTTVIHFQTYIDKLNEIIILDTIQSK